MDPPRVPHATRRHREPNGRPNEKRVVKACVTAGFHVLRFSHQNKTYPCPSGLSRSAVGTRGKRRGFFLARLWSPRILVSLFILQSIGRPGLGWRFDRRVADPATWNIQRLTRLLFPHFSPLFYVRGNSERGRGEGYFLFKENNKKISI
ncbi:unnamed protein product [Musa acuminata subsp. malaccensis]|uniref:(wild Malaysian banana) hypothetical protein n=1 Tax=Musa acuminata subsp. malaccensis TaxID=214687 RepID=A0A804JAN3_MUSAM|nr:unnamed protein product [Musa acuminata subsp. malaccensis]